MIEREKNKKGQEEMVGFVLIVVITAIVFVVMLGIFLRSPSKTAEKSIEVDQFLESMMEYTSDCAIGYAPRYASVGELLGHCYDGKTCVSNEDACKALNRTLNNVINNSWNIGPESYYTGYRFDADFSSKTSSGATTTKNIISLSKGNCTAFQGADYFLSHGDGNIDITLKICLNVKG